MTTRRDFLKISGLLSGACFLPGILSAIPAETQAKLPHFGIITGNTAGKWLEENPRKALKELAALGYRDLEFGGDFGMGVPALKTFLKECKLRPVAGPTSMNAMHDTQQLMKDIKACQELGQEYIVCYWPWTDGGENKTLDDWKKVADNLNKGGAICKKEGLKLLTHNHDIEFRLTEGQLPFDTLVPALDPELVNVELDLYWVNKGNQSPETFIRKYPGRFPIFHVKDMDKTPGRGFAYVGEGCIDFPSIFRLNKTAGVKHFIVEHDNPENPESCVKTAARYLSGLKF